MDREIALDILSNELRFVDTKKADELIIRFAKAHGPIHVSLHHWLLCIWNQIHQGKNVII